VDGVIDVDDTTAVEMTHYLLNYEGLFLGGSSGVNVAGAGGKKFFCGC
jgi:cysteine synthase